MDDIVFKVALLKGENGNDIRSITKTGTSGLVDTYTVTLTDGSTTTFEVTNGNGIASIEKTSTSGLVDTYTITLDNGDTSTFDVTNGIVVDSAMSTTSENPLQNKVITGEINTINGNISALQTETNNQQVQISDNNEESSTASKAYSVGDFLEYNGDLYKVISAIAQGDTLTIGTNISNTNIGAELAQTNTDVSNLQTKVLHTKNGNYIFTWLGVLNDFLATLNSLDADTLHNCVLEIKDTNNSDYVKYFELSSYMSGTFEFSRVSGNSTGLTIENISISSSSTYIRTSVTSSSITVTDVSTSEHTTGQKLRLLLR